MLHLFEQFHLVLSERSCEAWSVDVHNGGVGSRQDHTVKHAHIQKPRLFDYFWRDSYQRSTCKRSNSAGRSIRLCTTRRFVFCNTQSQRAPQVSGEQEITYAIVHVANIFILLLDFQGYAKNGKELFIRAKDRSH